MINRWGFGSNENHELGLGSDIKKIDQPTLLKLPGKVIDYGCGWAHSLAIIDGQRIYEWGSIYADLDDYVYILY